MGLHIATPWIREWERPAFSQKGIIRDVARRPLTAPCDRILALVGRDARDFLWGVLMPEILGAVETRTNSKGYVVAQVGSLNQVLTFQTHVGDFATAGSDHPIRVERDPETGEPSPYVHVRGGLEALIDAETDGGKKRSKKAAVYHQRLAGAYEARGDGAKALEHLEAAYKLDNNEDATKSAYLAKQYADKMVLEVTDSALQVLGGHGYIREYPVELWLRNGRGFVAWDGLAMA